MTVRCREDDLGVDDTVSFEELAGRREIVKALQNQRCNSPEGGDSVGPRAGEATLYTLRYGDDHRGATWYDREYEVVWLCGYRRHRSGAADDAFPYFEDLRAADLIYPSEDDYALLLRERGERFARMLQEDAPALLEAARRKPEHEVHGVLGGDVAASAVIHVVETLSDTFVAFDAESLSHKRFIQILAAFYPDSQFHDWVMVEELPTRQLVDGEVAFRISHG